MQPECILGTIFVSQALYIDSQREIWAIWNFCKNCISCSQKNVGNKTFSIYITECLTKKLLPIEKNLLFELF